MLKSTEAVDEYTVKVTLTEPFGAFVATLAHPACVLMSPQVIEQGKEACAERPVGTGQYLFKEWIAGDHTTVTLNKDWWGYDPEICGGKALAEPDAGFQSITFRPVGENASRVAMLQSGEADFIWPVPTESMETLAADENVYVGADEGIVVRYMFMNTQKAPFNDVRVRQAMNYAIDKDAYIAVVKNGLASKATSILGPATQHYKRNEPYAYDLEKARKLLTDAGYPDGFETSLICTTTTSDLKAVRIYPAAAGSADKPHFQSYLANRCDCTFSTLCNLGMVRKSCLALHHLDSPRSCSGSCFTCL